MIPEQVEEKGSLKSDEGCGEGGKGWGCASVIAVGDGGVGCTGFSSIAV